MIRPAPARPRAAAAGMLIDLVAPLALYYGLRASGVGIYPALLAGALVSAAGAAGSLARTRRITGTTVYAATMMLASTGVALLAGNPRFLLAREGWVTAMTGVWFLASIRSRRPSHRPLPYLFSRPLLEGRLRWPANWDRLWERSARFRTMWKISALLWGLGTMADSAARVVMAYTLPIDVVPALSSGLYLVTSAGILVATNVLYTAAGVYDPNSPIYHPVPRASRS